MPNSNSSSYRDSIYETGESPQTSASSLNYVRFNHRLIYSNRNKNSTVKQPSRYFRNQNLDLSSQLGYSNRSTMEKYRNSLVANTESSAPSRPSAGESSSSPELLANDDEDTDRTESLDENNNNTEYEDVPMCFSYLRDCAIYGLPREGRQKTWRKLIDWWIFSLTYDLKWVMKKDWKNILLLVISFILFEIFYLYFQKV